jgi:hypothetical protein
MCRVLAYLGDPVQLDGVLFEHGERLLAHVRAHA